MTTAKQEQGNATTTRRGDARRVLVIDAWHQLVSVVSWQRAFTMLLAGEARALDDRRYKAPEVVVYSRDGAVVGVNRTIPLPSVIKLGKPVHAHRQRQRVRFCRKNVLVGRDRGLCQYCGERFPTEDLTLDHVVPRSQRGATTWENIVAACIPCNQRKAGRTPEQAGMKLLRKPVKPSHVIETHVQMDLREVPEEWKNFWSIELGETKVS